MKSKEAINLFQMSKLRGFVFLCLGAQIKTNHKYMKNALVITLLLLMAGCSIGVFRGHVKMDDETPLQGVEVQFWQNKWIPLSLPERLATATTNSNGYFEKRVDRHVSFIVIEDKPITFSRSFETYPGAGPHDHEIIIKNSK